MDHVLIMNSVEIVMSGGIGNQLFQYWSGAALARRLNYNLKIDTSWFQNRHYLGAQTPREFKLGSFVLSDELITRSYMLPPGLVNQAKRFMGTRLFTEGVDLDDDLTDISGIENIRISGYWQNPRNFDSIIERVRSSTVRTPSDRKISKEYLQDIKLNQSIGIHVRRGDFANDPKTSKHHGLQKKDYFYQGVEAIRGDHKIDRLFIFSDEIKWCSENLRFPLPAVFVNDEVPACDQLKLLSYCNHHIISNSTFSWWAAWLGWTSNQIVVFPDQWLANKKVQMKPFDNWVSL
jgi:hypothetical protein